MSKSITIPPYELNFNIVDHPLTEEEELYKENILDHYRHPHNKQTMPGASCLHREFNPLCGDQVTVYLKLQNGIVEKVSFEGSGCAISQAAASMLTDFVKGKRVKELQKLGPWDIFNLLGIRISPARSKCALLGLKAVQRALMGKEG